ncbi:hypothetical protein VD0004_g1184 [Verticillium dahliae]|uniref:Uncharacterized protein n=1 Tax=Verticillium dahliae TaxID=27337 RepID=A0A366P7P0_VERDA|nr:hypothetical protein VdG1_08307 [Verticillium dahliae VDG1]PNH47026.1 hypothetical protein VD0004_g1184 [Verticillium dahliae]PNH76541.1 hypothetical protein VD0001_g977 [Verticillium dahliae]RBQ87967.1 hypothetical protein VDGD_00231 [Verticillium dahliae]RXG45659.1 hypothetical protein VDGE_00231 [Verticillium dahliae]
MSAHATTDPFDDVMNLEERFYEEGYTQGTKDGDRAGKIEGRSVGLANGYDKFLESGRLYGKSLVWANRLQLRSPSSAEVEGAVAASTPAGPASMTVESSTGAQKKCLLPPLPSTNSRLEKNIIVAHALVEPDTLSTENNDDAVNDFDNRVKKAQGKVKVIERILGEQPTGSATAVHGKAGGAA